MTQYMPFYPSLRKLFRILFFALLFVLLAFQACSADSFPSDFITGVDVSELTAQENSGVLYYNGLGIQEDALKILADQFQSHF